MITLLCRAELASQPVQIRVTDLIKSGTILAPSVLCAIGMLPEPDLWTPWMK